MKSYPRNTQVYTNAENGNAENELSIRIPSEHNHTCSQVYFDEVHVGA